MQANDVIIDLLNDCLTNELTAINQYYIHAKMCRSWGFERLGKKIYEESLGEMKHADKLIERILFLEGVPAISRYHPIMVGIDVPSMFNNDLKLEKSALTTLNAAIPEVIKLNDAGSRELFEHIVVDSEDHIDWLETQIELVGKIGLQNYLSEQL